jgi:hypothetical protein
MRAESAQRYCEKTENGCNPKESGRHDDAIPTVGLMPRRALSVFRLTVWGFALDGCLEVSKFHS